MNSSERGAYLDPLGFTKQTETILCGLGGDYLLPVFRKRNISTNALHKLSKTDFTALGADESDAERMFNQLHVMQKHFKHTQISFKDRIDDLFQILKYGEQQLSLLRAVVVYSRLRLEKEQINLFIDPDKNVRASEALYIGALCTLEEIYDAKQALIELDNFLSKDNQTCEHVNKSRQVCIKRCAITTTVIIIGYTMFFAYKYYKQL